MKKKKTVVILIIALILILAEKFFGGNASFPEREEGKLYMYAIDVGQADSTLILLPDGENILIDAGNREDTNLVVEFIKEKGIEKLDYVVATHPHEDHIGGMPGVIENFEIGTFYMPDSVHTTVYYEDMIDALIKWEVVTEFAEKGVKIKDGECSIDILSPLPREYDDFNHVSAVTRITYKDNSFLLMGDAEKINEYDIIDNYGDKIKSDVLKVGHHGSDTSSAYEFLETVDPELAVISLGKDNDYGHPHKEVKERLSELKIPYYRTDEVGTVLFISNGKKIEVITEKEVGEE